LDSEVGAYVEADPDFPAFMSKLSGLLELLLPRFVREGKKYLTIAIGCTGGRHRSVYVVEKLASRLAGQADWRLLVAHRELARDGHASAYLADRPAARPGEENGQSFGGSALPPVQAQEA